MTEWSRIIGRFRYGSMGRSQETSRYQIKKTDPKLEETAHPYVPKPDNVIDLGERQEKRKKVDNLLDDGMREWGPRLPLKKRKKKPRNRLKFERLPLTLIAAIASAVIVGVSFGIVVLTLFKDGGEAAELAATEVQSVAPAFEEGETGMPSVTMEIVQGGAFSTEEKGEEMVQAFQAQDFAAVLTKASEPLYLFIGIGGDRAQAEAVSSLYKESGQDTYLKSYHIKGNEVVAPDEDVVLWFSEAVALLQSMTQMSSDGLTKNDPSIVGEELKKIEQQLSDLQSERENVASKVPESALDDTLKMGNALMQAGQHLSESNEASFWLAQQALLEALIHYEDVVQKLA